MRAEGFVVILMTPIMEAINQNDGAVCRILLAEDSEDDAYFFQRALKKAAASCSFARAANGKLAIDMLQNVLSAGSPKALPDILFLDLKMPVKSGFDVLEWLRSANLNPPIKVVVLSGSNDHSDRQRASDLGAAEYLVKPITPENLKALIQEHAEAAR